MKKISQKEIEEFRKKGINILDGVTGKPLDFEAIEAKKDRENNKKLYESTQALVVKISETMTSMIGQLQIMNESLLSELKKHAPKTPNVNVEPKIDIQVPDTEPVIWKHRVTEMTPTGRALEIISTPKTEGKP